ncbi:MAG: zf-HC2 domain-containing protein [Alphaproteobacteria bacterium]|nr:zf-HC2 domain-containing protein [Alphaproteobacteria bacterium]
MTRDIETLLSAYVDGELDAEGVAEVEQLLALDPQARRHVERERETVGLLRAAFADTFFAEGATRLIAPRPARAGWPAAWAAAAAVVACVIGFGGGVLWSVQDVNPRVVLMDEATEYHNVFSHETTHLVEVPAEQADEIRRWLGRRLERRLEIPELSPAGLAFAGARMLVIDGKPVADLIYTRDRGGPVAICIARFEGAAEDLRIDRKNGQRVAMWSDGQFAYLVVGDLEVGAARAIAERVAEQFRG